MAITHNVSNSGSVAAGTSLSFNTVVAAGDNRAGIIGISWTEETFAVSWISSVTFDSVEATFVHMEAGPGGNNEHYYITGIGTGTKTLVVAWAAEIYPAAFTGVVGITIWDGVDQTTPIGATEGAIGSTAVDSITVPTTDADGLVVDTRLVQYTTVTTDTPGVDQTTRWERTVGAAPVRMHGHATTKPGSASGTTMSWTLASARNWVHVGTELRPYVEPVIPPAGDVNVRTSYDYLEVSPDKLDRNDRLPEEARMVWIGRWRH